MKTAFNRTRTFPGDSEAFEFPPIVLDPQLLDRLRACCNPFSPIDIDQHIQRIARVVMHARRHPFNKFASPTESHEAVAPPVTESATASQPTKERNR